MIQFTNNWTTDFGDGLEQTCDVVLPRTISEDESRYGFGVPAETEETTALPCCEIATKYITVTEQGQGFRVKAPSELIVYDPEDILQVESTVLYNNHRYQIKPEGVETIHHRLKRIILNV